MVGTATLQLPQALGPDLTCMWKTTCRDKQRKKWKQKVSFAFTFKCMQSWSQVTQGKKKKQQTRRTTKGHPKLTLFCSLDMYWSNSHQANQSSKELHQWDSEIRAVALFFFLITVFIKLAGWALSKLMMQMQSIFLQFSATRGLSQLEGVHLKYAG